MLNYTSVLDKATNSSRKKEVRRENRRAGEKRRNRFTPLEQSPPDYTRHDHFHPETTTTPASHDTKQKRFRGLLFASSILIAIVLINHQILFQRNSDNDTKAMVQHPPPTGNTNPGHRFFTIKQRLSPYLDDDVLRDTSSPQFQALEWISNRDGFKISPTDPLLLQRYVLAVLYYATGGPKTWKQDKKFLTPQHECMWNDDGGVRKCDQEFHVKDISLWNNLHGTIPSEIGYLSQLHTLYLSRNKLRGSIPTEIGQLTNLVYLGLQHNKITGTIPEEHLSRLSNLRYLLLEKNDLEGTILKVGPLCQMAEAGLLQTFQTDCRTLVKWKEPEVSCNCCTKCFLP